MSKSIAIMQTGNVWHTGAINGAPSLSDYSESALAAKVFQSHPECDVVAVMDGAGRITRTIHRNHASGANGGAQGAQE